MSQIKSIDDTKQGIKPVEVTKSEQESKSSIKPIRTVRDTGVTTDEFASNLPAWDLVPPLVAVRRIRKR